MLNAHGELVDDISEGIYDRTQVALRKCRGIHKFLQSRTGVQQLH